MKDPHTSTHTSQPAANTQQKRRKQPKKKRSLATNVVLSVILVLLLLFLAGFLFITSKLRLINYNDGLPKTVNGLREDDLDDEGDNLDLDMTGLELVEPNAIPEIDTKVVDSVLNVLLLGTDDRTLEFSDNARADSIILLSLNFEDNSAKLVSLERGMGVPILDGEYKGQYDWITHCFRYGGADLMMKEVQECFKIEVNHYVRVNLNALIKVVDAIGGIDVELTDTEAWYLNQSAVYGSNFGIYASGNIYQGDGTSEIRNDLKAGVNHLSGAMAVGYARLRAIDSDWQRIARQRAVIQAIANQLKSADLMTLNKLCDEVLPLVQTNFTQNDILNLMMKAPGFLGVTFDQMTIPAQGTFGGMTGMEGRGMFWPDWETNIQLLHEFLYGEQKPETAD